ncbi:MAG: hypothetical protein MI824_14950 [Hyphomicrobiales bacterium]|nr:hypothetical protein [Hyphomicrobiales bacterium]
MGIPIDVQKDMIWSARPDGSIALRINGPDDEPVEVEFPPRMMSLVIAEALLTTQTASEILERGGGRVEADIEELPAVPATKMALAPSTFDDHKTLVLEVGKAQLGFTIPDRSLAEFGRLLLQLDKS